MSSLISFILKLILQFGKIKDKPYNFTRFIAEVSPICTAVRRLQKLVGGLLNGYVTFSLHTTGMVYNRPETININIMLEIAEMKQNLEIPN